MAQCINCSAEIEFMPLDGWVDDETSNLCDWRFQPENGYMVRHDVSPL